MHDTVTRMPPGAALADPAETLVQGWALSEHPPEGRRRAADLLFLPGMAAGAWMWAPRFLAPFRQAGFRCWTITFSGRVGGQTLATDPGAFDRLLSRLMDTRDARAALADLARILPGSALRDGPGLDTFAAETEAALGAIGRPCLVIGHSLGGAVAQAVLRRGRARPRATALLCPVPPYGLWRASAQLALTDPGLWSALAAFGLGQSGAADMERIRRSLFPAGIGEPDFRRVVANLRDESFAALLQSLGLPPFAPWPGPRRDVSVFGATRDPLVPPPDIHATAAWYGGFARLLPRAGHLPMLGRDGDATAARLLRWAGAEVPT